MTGFFIGGDMPELIPSSGEPSEVTLFRSLTVGEGQVDEENR